MWYEDGQLRPFLVRLIASISPFRGGRDKAPKREVPRSGERRHRVSVPGGSHQNRGRERSRQSNPREGGDNRQWQRKPRAGRRRPARNGKLTSPVKKRGRLSPPFRLSGIGVAGYCIDGSLGYRKLSFTSTLQRSLASPREAAVHFRFSPSHTITRRITSHGWI